MHLLHRFRAQHVIIGCQVDDLENNESRELLAANNPER